MLNENGNGTTTAENVKKIFGVPCQGCTQRAEIMGAGEWKLDALIVGTAVAIVAGYVIYRYTDFGKAVVNER